MDSANKVLNVVMDSISEKSCPYDGVMVMVAYDYYNTKNFTKANTLAKKLFDQYEKELKYYHTLDAQNVTYYGNEIQEDTMLLERLAYFSQSAGQAEVAKDFQARLDKLEKAGMLKGAQQ